MNVMRPMRTIFITFFTCFFIQTVASDTVYGGEPTGMNTLKGQPRLTIEHDEIGVAVDIVILNPEGSSIVTISENNLAKIWSTESGDLLRTINLAHAFRQVDSNGATCVPAGNKDPWCTATIASANFSPDGKRLITAAFWDPTARCGTLILGGL